MTRRAHIPRRIFGTLWNRQHGICACGCGQSLEGQQVDIEHQLPVALGGTNDEANLSLWLREHHKRKTAQDVRRIAKARRQQLYHETGRSHRHAVKQIQSRGFDKRLSRRMDGSVVARDA